MTNLDKARQWAENLSTGSVTDKERAVADVILSLPDQWVDAEKARALIASLNAWAEDADAERSHGRALGYRTAAENLATLLPAPSLPTLADMTQEERAACQWMQADVKLDISGATVRRVIAHPGTANMKASVWSPYGGSEFVDTKLVTPLSYLDKLKWPAQEPRNPETPPAETLNNTSLNTPRNPRPKECCGKCPETISGGYDCTCEDNPRCSKNTPDQAVAKDMCNKPRPADVPANELWLVEHDGLEFLAKRDREDAPYYPWRITSANGLGTGIAGDIDITLIHKLVPETHTLPKGIRLADHAKYGRVVTSPQADDDVDYKIFFPIEDNGTGADIDFAHESELTFLDG